MKFRALLIATSTYRSMTLPDIPSAANDVDALADALAGPGPDRSEVETLRNPSLGEVRQALSSALASASRDTTLLVHFACHGIVDPVGRSFLALADTDPEHPFATAFEADSMMELIQQSNAGSVVVVLNACMTGTVRPTRRFGPDLHGVTPTSTAVLSCTYSRTLAGERHSRFTQALIDALRSDETDPDRDGVVTAQELYTQVVRSMRDTGDRQLLYAGVGNSAALPMARLPREWLSAGTLERTARRTELGPDAYRLSWGSAFQGFVAVEVYPGQYSVNWHTAATAPDFVRRCRRSHDSQVLVETSSGEQLDTSGLDVWWLVSRAELDPDVRLVRYWLRDASVAWQRPDPSGPAIIGIASDTVDVEAITWLLRRTATVEVLEHERQVIEVIGSLDGLNHTPLSEFRTVVGEEE